MLNVGLGNKSFNFKTKTFCSSTATNSKSNSMNLFQAAGLQHLGAFEGILIHAKYHTPTNFSSDLSSASTATLEENVFGRTSH